MTGLATSLALFFYSVLSIPFLALTIYESVPQYGATDIAQDPKITIQFTKPITLVKKTTATNPLFYVQIGTQVPVSFTAEQAVTTVGRTTIVIDLYEALHASLPASTRIRFYFGTGLSTPVVADDGSTLIQAPFMDGETPRSYLTFYTGEGIGSSPFSHLLS